MWQIPEDPANEADRLAVLEACRILDTPSDERFDRITWLARRSYDADVAFLSFMDSSHQWVKAATPDASVPTIERRQSVCQHVISTHAPLVSPDLKTDPRFAGHPTIPRLSMRFYAGVPLLVGGDIAIGSLCVMSETGRDLADTFDFEPLQKLAAIAVDTVELWRRNDELAHQSRRDALTGLANRRGFDDALGRVVGRCRRTGEELALLMIDLDRFKSINDEAGHLAGDVVLRRVGEVLGAAPLRTGDVVARFGGEEFAVLLPGSRLQDAAAVAARLRAALAGAAVPRPDGGSVTASIGVAAQIADEIDPLALISAADAALYRAKHAGRDRVAC